MVVLLLSAATLQSQSNRLGLITQAVDESQLVTLSGNRHPLATPAADRGLVPASMPANRMFLLLRRSQDQERALNLLIESLHDSNSPNFHQWLTPAQFGAQWGASDSDIAAVTAWLQSHGFEVAGPSSGRTAIEFSGTAGQIQEAFHTEIHLYEVNGVMHHANAADPQIPAALAPIVAGVSSLNDFYPRSMARKGSQGIYDAKTQRIYPDLTFNESSYNLLFLGPADAATIYNSPIKALNPKATGATIDGTGAKIGIIGDSNISTSQNVNYRSLFGLAANAPTVVVDGPDPGENADALEAYLDTEVANGIAPGAKLYFYTAANTNANPGVFLALERALHDNLVDVLSLSFGECEAGLGTYLNKFIEGEWEQAAAQGISVTVSAGDAGSAGCDDFDTESQAVDGLQINGLASTPFNIAVGGTDFAALAGPDGSGANFTNYVSEASDPKTLRSAKGFIPEVPWNESNYTFPPGTYTTNVPVLDQNGNSNIVAGGGGRSNCSVGSVDKTGHLSCTSGYPKPSWQSAPGVPSDKIRDVPDVSLFASDFFYYAAWGICIDQEKDSGGNPIELCVPGANGLPPGDFYIIGAGGTSSAAPAFAGILALVRQSTGQRQGQADYVFYNLAKTSPGVFHDVVTGNNSVPCAPGSDNCSKNAAGNYFLTGYDAGAGYDLASGLGSVNVSALISKWASAGLSPTTTQLTVTPLSIQHGQSVAADATVTSANGFETGDVMLTADVHPPLNPAIGTYKLDSAGSTGVLRINSLPGGSYNVVASYDGSAQDSKSVSPGVSVTVTPEASTTIVTSSAQNPTTGDPYTGSPIPYGYSLDFTAHPYGNHSQRADGVLQPDGDATGNVKFTAGSVDLGTAVLASNGEASLAGRFLSPGSKVVVEAAYEGDPSFDPSLGAQALAISKAATELKLAVNETTYDGKPFIFTAALSSGSGGAAPTGNVELMIGSTLLGEGKLVGVAGSKIERASGTAEISILTLPPTKSAIFAKYLGDANYDSSTSAAIAVTGRPTFKLTGGTIELLGEHTTAAGFLSVASEGGYSGTIKLTCELLTKTSTATPPECAMYPATETLAAGGTVLPEILIFGKGTKLPPGITLGSNSNGNAKWVGAGSVVLACCLFFGIPSRRRGWRAMLSAILLLVAIGGFTACVTTPKFITAGQYTFTVTATDSKDSTLTSTANVTVRVL